jgi:putative membrane protein
MRTALALIALLLVLATPPGASAGPAETGNQKTSAALTDDELRSLAHFHHVNQVEISIGKLAAAKGTTKVRAYGKMLLRDHTRGDRDLMALVTRLKVTLPEDTPRDDEEARIHQDMMDTMKKLETLEGAEFDAMLMPAMLDGHDRELVRIDAAIATATQPKVIALFKKTKPVLHKHADQVRKLAPPNRKESP